MPQCLELQIGASYSPATKLRNYSLARLASPTMEEKYGQSQQQLPNPNMALQERKYNLIVKTGRLERATLRPEWCPMAGNRPRTCRRAHATAVQRVSGRFGLI